VENHESPNLAVSGEVNVPETGNLAKFGDRTSSSSLYNKTTTTADSLETGLDSLPAVEKAAAAASYSPKGLKDALSALDGRLSLDKKFYPEAAVFMSERGLGIGYLSWLRGYCESMEYRSFDGLFFSLFFKDNIVEKYFLFLSESKPKESMPPRSVVACPVCAAHHDPYEDCPSCGLPHNPSQEQVMLYSELHGLPPEMRDEYLSREEGLLSGDMNLDELKKVKAMIDALKQEFGLTVGV